MRVADGAVVEVGTGLSRPEGVTEIDAAGRWLSPGLWDQHVHLGQWTLARQRFDLTDATSAEEVVRRVADHVADAPGRPVIGWGHRPGGWPHAGRVADLDAVTGVTPVVLIAGDAHHAWLNSAALAALGLPPREGPDETVRENEWFAAYSLLYDLTGTDGTSPPAYRASLEAAAAQGVVGLVDFEFVGGVAEWLERWDAGCDLLRVRAATYIDGLDDVVRRGLRSGDPLDRTSASRWVRSRSSATARSTPGRPGAASRTPTVPGSSTPAAPPTSPSTSCATSWPARTCPASRSRPTRSATPPSAPPSMRTPPPAPAARSSTPSWSPVPTYAASPSWVCAPACSRPTCSTTATSPS